MIDEYLDNKDYRMVNTRDTLVNLTKEGKSFFLSRVSGKDRFIKLFQTNEDLYIDECLVKLKEKDYLITADLLYKNRQIVKEML